MREHCSTSELKLVYTELGFDWEEPLFYSQPTYLHWLFNLLFPPGTGVGSASQEKEFQLYYTNSENADTATES
jgi:hypothetical protein